MEVIIVKIEDFDSLVKDGSMTTESIIKVRDSIIELNNQIESLTSKNKESEDKINELRDSNARLYLRVTNGEKNNFGENELSLDEIIKNWGRF